MRTAEDEIRQLRDAVRGTLAAGRDGWPALAELGLAGLCAPESLGGSGLHVGAAVAVAEELGAALHPSPFAGITASVHALAAAGDELAGPVVAGEAVCAYGVLRGGRAWAVDGAPGADALLLRDADGDGLLLLTDPAGWAADASRHTFDVGRAAADVAVAPGAGRPLPADPLADELHRLLLAADAVGAVRHVLDRTVAYAGERVAFGRPIGGFQAVQHRLADHAVRVRGLGLAVAEAARLLGADDPGAARAVAVAEVGVATHATRILHDLLQLTGGIGFTWEHGLHLHERRVHHDARLAAGPRAATRTLAAIEGWGR